MRLAAVAPSALAVAAAFLLVLAGACTSAPSPAPILDAGPTEAQSLDDAGDATDATDASAPFPLGQVCPAVTDPSVIGCTRCNRESCCETARIRDTEAGNEIIDCIQAPGCDISSCQETCFRRFPAQTPLLLQHIACLAHRCTAPCAAPPDECAQCQEQNCLTELLACDLSQDCFLLTGCSGECDGDEACQAACAGRYSGARALQGAWLVCISNHCSTECGKK